MVLGHLVVNLGQLHPPFRSRGPVELQGFPAGGLLDEGHIVGEGLAEFEPVGSRPFGEPIGNPFDAILTDGPGVERGRQVLVSHVALGPCCFVSGRLPSGLPCLGVHEEQIPH